ncbi:MAG: hypothetical protein ACRC0L_03500, partial [Angustibacter sp.]
MVNPIVRSRRPWLLLLALVPVFGACSGGDGPLRSDSAAPRSDSGSGGLGTNPSSPPGISLPSGLRTAPSDVPEQFDNGAIKPALPTQQLELDLTD